MDIYVLEAGCLYQELITADEMTNCHMDFLLHLLVIILFDDVFGLLQEESHFLFVRSGNLFLVQQCVKVLYITGIKEEIAVNFSADIINRTRINAVGQQSHCVVFAESLLNIRIIVGKIKDKGFLIKRRADTVQAR